MNTAVARVFTSGNSQAIRLPKQLRLSAHEVFIHQDKGKLIIHPIMPSWEGFAEGFTGLSDDFSAGGALPADMPRYSFDED